MDAGRVSGAVQRLRVNEPTGVEVLLRTQDRSLADPAGRGARFTQDTPELQLDGAEPTSTTLAIGRHGAVLRYEPPN